MRRNTLFLTMLMIFVCSMSFAQYKFTVVLDAAHGGKDPGTAVGDFMEKDVVLEVAHLIQKMNDNEDVNILLTRKSDDSMELMKRVEMTEEINPDLLLSLHINKAAENLPFMIFASPKNPSFEKSKAYAESLQEYLNPNDIVPFKEMNFMLISRTTCPALLIEMGNAGNEENLKIVMEDSYKEDMAKRILSYIHSFVNS